MSDGRNGLTYAQAGVDIDAGKRNGLSTVAVHWGFGGPEELASANADYSVQTPGELTLLFEHE